jgi:hypothetical protein
MAEKDLLSKEEIDSVWAACSSDLHEDIERAALEVMTDITEELSIGLLDDVRKLVHSIDKNSYDELQVTFLKNFIIAEMRNMNERDENEAQGRFTFGFSTLKKMFKRADDDDSELS